MRAPAAIRCDSVSCAVTSLCIPIDTVVTIARPSFEARGIQRLEQLKGQSASLRPCLRLVDLPIPAHRSANRMR